MSSTSAHASLTALLLTQIIEDMEREEKRKSRKKRYWVNPFLSKRPEFDIEFNLLKDLIYSDNKEHRNFLRLPYEMFCELHELVHPRIGKEDTNMRCSISSKVKLAVTLRFLATGDSFKSLGFLSHISPSTISVFLPEVLKAIFKCLQPTYLKFPENQSEWEKIRTDFEELWHFPHTLGALDGKHIRIKKPNNAGSMFHNYKSYHSIILLALVDAHCRFIYIDVGSTGRSSDGGVFMNSTLYKYTKSGKACFPPAASLPGQANIIPHFYVADDAFALDKHLMKPYSRCRNLTTLQEIFNYRICRARLTVEAAFGRMASRFRILHRPIEVKVDTADWVVKCCCVLHNYLTIPKSKGHTLDDLQPEKLPATVQNITMQNRKQTYKNSSQIRDEISEYCVQAGDVSFQWKKIKRSHN